MIKVLFKPFFKRFFGLFISMAFVSMLSIALLCTFGSTVFTLKDTYNDYLQKHELVDELVVSRVSLRDDLVEAIKDIDDIEKYDTRLSIDTFVKKENDTIMARVFTYNEANDKIFKRLVLEKTDKKPNADDTFEISICKRFADNNNFKLEQTIQLGYFGTYFNFYISEIVESPEGIYPRVNDYLWTDTYDFGFAYVSESELGRCVNYIYNELYDELKKKAEEEGIEIPSKDEFNPAEFVALLANQMLIKNKDGVKTSEVIRKLEAAFEKSEIHINNITPSYQLPYRAYMDNAMRQLRIASLFLPIFFYIVTMIIVGLFTNQIIKAMTPQIGVMMSVGVGKKDIISIFILFSLLMSIVAGAIGLAGGYGLTVMFTNVMRSVYSMPFIPAVLNPWVSVLAVFALIIFVEVATMISCSLIFKITPKDATISNESKRKQLPKWLDRTIDRAPMNIKLGLNSVAQNPKRFFVSTFAIFASITLILLSGFFYVAKNEMIHQSVSERLRYDAQVYFAEQKDDEFLAELKKQETITEVEDCFYTYTKASNSGGTSVYLECLAINDKPSNMIHIPDEKGTGTTAIESMGIVLGKHDAEVLNVKVGDNIIINEKNVKVTSISFQYFHPITYMSKNQLKEVTSTYVSSYLLDIEDTEEARQATTDYISQADMKSITVFTSKLGRDLYNIFDALDIFIIIMIIFSIGISFIILLIMSQNALMEQQRQLTVFRAIGFTVMDISNFWTLQSVLQLIASSILGIPAGIGASIMLFKLTSSGSQTYPFILSYPVILLAVGFILIVLLACHLISMHSIKKWNIADNTRSRE